MERNLLIELLEDGDKVSLYSPHFEGEDYSEFEKFLLTYKDTYPDDVKQLVYRLDIIKRDGAADRHFRYEGTKRDRVMALPSHLETTSLRLYLLNIQAKILILGNGGLKTTATYQEDDYLHRCVKTLQKIDIELKAKEHENVIVIKGTELHGIMKTNRIMDEIRSTISPEMKLQMEMSVSIANRIYEILEAKGMTQKDLAKRLGKTETEVSRWLSGTHNLTLSTICKISAALGDPILQVVHQVESSPAYEFEPMMASEPLSLSQ